MAELTVIGIGNVLMGDEGVGVHLLEAVKLARDWPASVEFIDGGVGGLGLINYIEEASQLIVFDAAEMNLPAGQWRIIQPGQLAREDETHRLSMHEMPFVETLDLCREFLKAPDQVTILAIQPRSTDNATGLSQILRDEMPALVNAAITLVEQNLPLPAE